MEASLISEPRPIAGTKTSEYFERSDGIIIQRVVSAKKQQLSDVKENIATFNRLAAGRPRSLLVDMQASFSTGPGVREYYATEEASRYVAACAMVTHSRTTTMIGNFFMTINKPPYPCRLFTAEAPAISWLKTVQA